MAFSQSSKPASSEKKQSYVWEMIRHPWSVSGAGMALLAGAVLSIPFGLGVGVIPLVGFLAGEGIASLFVPSDPRFREKVDKRHRDAVRKAQRKHLIWQIKGRVGNEGQRTWSTYHRMMERVDSLTEVASSRATKLTGRDVERLSDATLDYLGLWLAQLVMVERRATIDDRSLAAKIANLQVQIEDAQTPVERRRLEKAKSDLEGVLASRRSLDTRLASVEAAMLAMSNTFEELYQRIVTNPGSGDVARELERAVDEMRIEENLDLALEQELGELTRPLPPARVAQKA